MQACWLSIAHTTRLSSLYGSPQSKVHVWSSCGLHCHITALRYIFQWDWSTALTILLGQQMSGQLYYPVGEQHVLLFVQLYSLTRLSPEYSTLIYNGRLRKRPKRFNTNFHHQNSHLMKRRMAYGGKGTARMYLFSRATGLCIRLCGSPLQLWSMSGRPIWRNTSMLLWKRACIARVLSQTMCRYRWEKLFVRSDSMR